MANTYEESVAVVISAEYTGVASPVYYEEVIINSFAAQTLSYIGSSERVNLGTTVGATVEVSVTRLGDAVLPSMLQQLPEIFESMIGNLTGVKAAEHFSRMGTTLSAALSPQYGTKFGPTTQLSKVSFISSYPAYNYFSTSPQMDQLSLFAGANNTSVDGTYSGGAVVALNTTFPTAYTNKIVPNKSIHTGLLIGHQHDTTKLLQDPCPPTPPRFERARKLTWQLYNSAINYTGGATGLTATYSSYSDGISNSHYWQTLNTSTVTGNVASIRTTTDTVLTGWMPFRWCARVMFTPRNTNSRFWAGFAPFTSDMDQDDLRDWGIAFRWSGAADGTNFFRTQTAGGGYPFRVTKITTFPFEADKVYYLEIVHYGGQVWNGLVSKVEFYINGILVSTHSGSADKVPAGTVNNMGWVIHAENLGSQVVSLKWGTVNLYLV